MQMNISRVGSHYESASIQACLRTRISLRPLETRAGMRSDRKVAEKVSENERVGRRLV